MCAYVSKVLDMFNIYIYIYKRGGLQAELMGESVGVAAPLGKTDMLVFRVVELR